MRGDFSRVRFNQDRHYTSVLQQQGRVALDADANEQCAIDHYLRETESVDVIGPYGAPRGNAGFEIAVQDSSIVIGPNRYYVFGLLCENKTSLTYDGQPYLLNPAHSSSDLLSELTNGASPAIRLFLEVWERLVTALDDPCLREPALGQADTTARRQTVWRVVAEPEPAATQRPRPGPGRGLEERSPAAGRISQLTAALAASKIKLSDFDITKIDPSTNPTNIDISKIDLSNIDVTRFPIPFPFPNPQPVVENCCAEMYKPVETPAPGKLGARTSQSSAGDCSCEPTPAAGYRGLENQLYRVEIHHGGDENSATFKWSRENGSIIVAITGVSGAQVTVDSLGPDANLGFAPGQWVEITDDTYQFGQTPNQPGDLFQIKSIAPETLTVTMTAPVSIVDPTKNARLRRWDQGGASATSNGVALATQSWIDLENGIQAEFAPGQFRTGDYWLIPARTASGEIDWPPCGSDGAQFQTPHRTSVYRAPLACIHWDGIKQQDVVEDCRRFFSPLTELAATGVSQSLHVSKISWSNDDIMTLDQLLANGLTVTLDRAPAGKIDAGTFALSLEIPTASQAETVVFAQGFAPIVERAWGSIDGQVTVKDSTILWQIPFTIATGQSYLHLSTIFELNNALLRGTSYGAFARARVKLSGSMIFAGNGLEQQFLDGQACGAGGLRADGITPRIDLQLPSGGNLKASDFESWFYLAPVVQITNLTIEPTAVSIVFSQTAGIGVVDATGKPVTPQATLTLNYAPGADTTVNLSVSGPGVASQIINIPATVTVPRNQSSVKFNVLVVANTFNQSAEVFQIIASLPAGADLSSTAQASLSVTGFVVIG